MECVLSLNESANSSSAAAAIFVVSGERHRLPDHRALLFFRKSISALAGVRVK
jgi:hypothetical protein